MSDDATNEPISFSFVVDQLSPEEARIFLRPYGGRYYRPHLPEYRDVHFTVSIIATGGQTRISRINIRIGRPKLSYEILIGEGIQISSIKVDNVEAYESIQSIKLQITPGSIFPELTVVRAEKKERVRDQTVFYHEINEFSEPIQNFLKANLKRLSDRWVNSISHALFSMGAQDRREIVRELGAVGPKIWQTFIADVCGPDKRDLYTKFHSVLSLTALPSILSRIRAHLRAVITETLYIGPARARSERYYRYQDLAVSEIDPDGKNFPMFLNSLASYQINNLSRWIQDLFGYGLSVERQIGGGHMSINLVARGVTSNIVDTGYGISQILPVLGQIWWARNRPARDRDETPLSLLAIEQPELHLHPAHQALLADALVGEIVGTPNTSVTSGNRINFLIETHSETLLNRLGELVAQRKIKHDDIQIVIFEALDDESRQTDVRTSSFSESGELINWPYGFFQPTVK